MSAPLHSALQSAEEKIQHAAVSPDSRMDRWARARGAALVESVVTATRRNG